MAETERASATKTMTDPRAMNKGVLACHATIALTAAPAIAPIVNDVGEA